MRRWPMLLWLIALALLPLVAACGDNSDDNEASPTATQGQADVEATSTLQPDATPTEPPEPTTGDSPTATAPGTEVAPTPTATPEPLTLSVYFIRDEKVAAAHRVVPHTLAVGAAAMEQLLAGPTELEADYGFTSAIPVGTEFLGLEIEDGVAIVDLSSEFESGGGALSTAARLAQVTFTLTQFPTVDAVEFRIEGEPVEVFGGEGLSLDHPVDRSNYEELTPAIFVESPTVGDSVSSPLHVWGTANTFEATFVLNIVDPEGLIVAEQVVTATSGTGTRGTFDVTVEFDVSREGMGAVIVFERSARDGEPVNIFEIPVEMTG